MEELVDLLWHAERANETNARIGFVYRAVRLDADVALRDAVCSKKAGLAGVTGFCGMARILMRAPWNRAAYGSVQAKAV